jgi:hypothetical protein
VTLAEAAPSCQQPGAPDSGGQAITTIKNALVIASGSQPSWKVSPVSIPLHDIHTSDSADATLTTLQPPKPKTTLSEAGVRKTLEKPPGPPPRPGPSAVSDWQTTQCPATFDGFPACRTCQKRRNCFWGSRTKTKC